MDLNRQALLTLAITVLGPAAVWHGWHPARLARTIAGHAVLPGTRRSPASETDDHHRPRSGPRTRGPGADDDRPRPRPPGGPPAAGGDARPAAAVRAWAATVVVLELAAVAVAVVSLPTSTGRPAGMVLAVAGAAFVGYVALLLRRGYQGDCGCTPVAASVTVLSVVPGAVLLVAGLVLAADPALDDVALAQGSGGLDTALALGAAGLLGALVSLLPASALTGDPRSLAPDARAPDTARGDRTVRTRYDRLAPVARPGALGEG